MDAHVISVVGWVVAQSDSGVIDQVESALESAQVTGWQVFWAIVVLIAAYPAGRLAARLVRRSLTSLPGEDNVPVLLVQDVSKLTKWMVWLVALGIALAILGVDIGWLTIAIIFTLGVAILALRPVIENTAAGLVLTVRPSWSIGDQIEFDGNRGAVVEIGSRSTVIETVDGVQIHTPNSKMVAQTVTVYTAKDSRRAEFSMDLDSSTDVGHAIELFTAALKSADVIVDDPAPDVVASGFGGDGITLTARVWYPSSLTSDSPALDASVQAVTSALQKAGIKLNKNDVTLEQVSPTFDVTVHDDSSESSSPPPAEDSTEDSGSGDSS
jgi:small-conductance mechanosensitive channel